MHLKRVLPPDFPALQRFYKQAGYKGKASTRDENWVLVDDNEVICAAARIVLQAHERILRGVWVAADVQHQGIGSALLRQLSGGGHLAQCYTFPYQHLVSFYQRAGFAEVAATPHLMPLLQRYNRDGQKVALMRYMDS